MKKLILIDAHALIHRFFHALPPLTTPRGAPIQAIYGLARILLKLTREERPAYLAAAFDRPEATFRKTEFADYKIHRPPAADDLVSQFNEARKIFSAFGVPICEAPGFEADDLIGTLVEKFHTTPDLQIEIISGDLDLLQLVEGERVVVRIVKNGLTNTIPYGESAVRERYGVNPSQLTDYKGLVGDTSDNIPGVKGIGPKTASELIAEFASLEGVLDNLVIISPRIAEKIEAHKDKAILSKRLATIRRDAPLHIASIEELKTQSPTAAPSLKAYLESLGFSSIVRDLNA
jgi:DNA polymerase-1